MFDLEDYGVSYEEIVYYINDCPYQNGDERRKCKDIATEDVTRNMCYGCKCEWLDSEVNYGKHI